MAAMAVCVLAATTVRQSMVLFLPELFVLHGE